MGRSRYVEASQALPKSTTGEVFGSSVAVRRGCVQWANKPYRTANATRMVHFEAYHEPNWRWEAQWIRRLFDRLRRSSPKRP